MENLEALRADVRTALEKLPLYPEHIAHLVRLLDDGNTEMLVAQLFHVVGLVAQSEVEEARKIACVLYLAEQGVQVQTAEPTDPPPYPPKP